MRNVYLASGFFGIILAAVLHFLGHDITTLGFWVATFVIYFALAVVLRAGENYWKG